MRMTTEMEVTLLEEAHELSLSKEEAIAAKGRFIKAVGIPAINWIDAEDARGEPIDKVGASLVLGISSILVHFAQQYVDPELHAKFLSTTMASLKTVALEQADYVNGVRGQLVRELHQRRTGRA